MKVAFFALGLIALATVSYFCLHRFSLVPSIAPPVNGDAPPPATDTPLTDAVEASRGDAIGKARIEALLAKGANPNSTDARGRPALTLAVRANDLAAAELLLDKGADPNGRDREMQWTPLMHATFIAAHDVKAIKMISLLLAKRADPNAVKDNMTALHVAVMNTGAGAKDVPVIEILLHGGAKADGVPAGEGESAANSPIVLAAWNGKTAAALALARAGADVTEGARAAREHNHPELAAALEALRKKSP